MKLNKLEFIAMNSPIRAFIQEVYEFNILRSLSPQQNAHNALEIGCGNGTGTKLIKKFFSPVDIIGIDFDPRMIKIASKRYHHRSISFQVMDASKLDFPDHYFDAVYDLGIIHHIPNWQIALAEIKRVLKPAGELIVEDLSIHSFSNGIGRLWRVLSDHPYQSMYTPEEFTGFLIDIGFDLDIYHELNPLRLVKFFCLHATKIHNK